MDLYSRLAEYHGTERRLAKLSFLLLLERAGGINTNPDTWSDSFVRTARLQPLVLDTIPNEIRVELLEHYGFVLGTN